MSNPKRLSPLAILFNVFKLFKQASYFVLTFAVIVISDGYLKYVLLGLLVLTVLFIVLGALTWLRFTYEVSTEQIHIKHGVFIRKDRYISKNRIQSIDLTQGIFHRPFGLTKVDLETAGNDKDVDANLSAVKYNEGLRIQELLKGGNDDEGLVVETSDYPKRAASQKDLWIAGATSGSIGVILGLFGAAFSQIENIIPDTFYDATTRWLLAQAIESLIVIALVIVIFLWLIGILGSLIKYGDFQITRYEHELLITRGLLEKKQMTIPLKRIQAIGIEESIIRQPFGFATIYVVIAGGEIGKTAEAHTLLFPIIRKKKIDSFLENILPEYNALPKQFNSIPKRAIGYYLIRAVAIPILLLVVTLIFFQNWWMIAAILVAISLWMGWMRYRDAGYQINDQYLSVRFRILSKETVLIPKRRIQSVEWIHHFLHRKQGLAQLKVSILSKQSGRHLWVKELDEKEHNKIIKWLEN